MISVIVSLNNKVKWKIYKIHMVWLLNVEFKNKLKTI